MKFFTKLWKRSAKSFATTIPHGVLAHIDEQQPYQVVWEYDSKIQRWTIVLQQPNEGKNK